MEAATDERIRNTRLFDVKTSDGTDGTLTVAPGAIAFEVRKRSEKNDKKNISLPVFRDQTSGVRQIGVSATAREFLSGAC